MKLSKGILLDFFCTCLNLKLSPYNGKPIIIILLKKGGHDNWQIDLIKFEVCNHPIFF